MPSSVREWQPDLVETPASLTGGSVHPGARWRATVEEPGRGCFQFEASVVAMAPPERITYHVDEPSSSADLTYFLMADSSGTALRTEMNFELKGPLRLLSFIARPMVRRKLGARLRLLRDVAQDALRVSSDVY